MYRVPYPRQSSLWNADGSRKQFSVYIVSNNSMTLYTGVTNDLRRRTFEHKNGLSDFTSRYHFDRLVYFETFDLVVDAIAREKAIKGMKRAAEDRDDQEEEPNVEGFVRGAVIKGKTPRSCNFETLRRATPLRPPDLPRDSAGSE